jgi:hypothetical protein
MMATTLEVTYDDQVNELTIAIRSPGQTDLHIDVTPAVLEQLVARAKETPGEPATG